MIVKGSLVAMQPLGVAGPRPKDLLDCTFNGDPESLSFFVVRVLKFVDRWAHIFQDEKQVVDTGGPEIDIFKENEHMSSLIKPLYAQMEDVQKTLSETKRRER
ncbi:UNVERIFIED_CONTAM: hypothetical protein K2H54_065400 [Gekko kuhli]